MATDDTLEAIRERMEAATDGPWVYDAPQGMNVVRIPSDRGGAFVVSDFGIVGNRVNDARFIAHAPTDIAHLLDVAEAAEWLLSAYRAGLERDEMEKDFDRLRTALHKLEGEDDG